MTVPQYREILTKIQTAMEERRLYPRHVFEHTVELCGTDGRVHGAETTELTAIGVGMLVSHDDVVALAQGGAILTPGDGVSISLPDPRGPEGRWLSRVHCRVKQVRRISVDRYVVGVWFDGLSPTQQAAISRLVEQASEGRG
jgi:hypothetical protein